MQVDLYYFYSFNGQAQKYSFNSQRGLIMSCRRLCKLPLKTWPYISQGGHILTLKTSRKTLYVSFIYLEILNIKEEIKKILNIKAMTFTTHL